jgi:hypothetical protein
MSDTAGPETQSVIIVCTTAGGLGDAVFGLNLAVGLVTRSLLPLHVSLVLRNALGGDDLEANIVRLKDELMRMNRPDVALFSMDRENSVTSVWPHHCRLPARALAVVQAPLFVYSTIYEAVSVLGVDGAPQKGLITVREYGHGQFSKFSMPSSGARDMSSGIGSDEIGMFDLRSMDARVQAPPRFRQYVGHFRSAPSLAKLCRSVLAIEAISWLDRDCAEESLLPCVDVLWDWSAGGIDACVAEFRKAGCTLEGSNDSSDSASTLCDPVPVIGDDSRGLVVKYPVPSADDVVVQFCIRTVDLGRVKPPVSEFRTLLSCCSAAVVCGDQSLNEVRVLPTFAFVPSQRAVGLLHVAVSSKLACLCLRFVVR